MFVRIVMLTHNFKKHYLILITVVKKRSKRDKYFIVYIKNNCKTIIFDIKIFENFEFYPLKTKCI